METPVYSLEHRGETVGPLTSDGIVGVMNSLRTFSDIKDAVITKHGDGEVTQCPFFDFQLSTDLPCPNHSACLTRDCEPQ